MRDTYTLIGLTGPTGSGKTSVTDVMKEYGFAIVNADEVAHKALEDKELLKALVKAFGEGILNIDGSINRRETAKIAFCSKENTHILNSLTHPVILKLAADEFKNLASKGHNEIIFDAPTLFESGSHTLCDKIISVVAPLQERVRRVVKRDKITEEEAFSRVSAQKENSFYTEKSDYVIENSGDFCALREKVLNIIKELRSE